HFLKYLRRERRYTREIKVLAFGKCVADLEIAGIKKSYHVAGKCLVNHIFVAGQESIGIAKPDILIQPHVMEILISFKPSRTHPQKSDPVAVLRVEVGMYLKYKSAKLIFAHIHHACSGFAAARDGRNADEIIQHLL